MQIEQHDIFICGDPVTDGQNLTALQGWGILSQAARIDTDHLKERLDRRGDR